MLTLTDTEPATMDSLRFLEEINAPTLEPGFPEGPLLKTTKDLQRNDWVGEESFHRLKNAKVFFADYKLLQHDFYELEDKSLVQAHPELANLTGSAFRKGIHAKIDEWLIKHTALMSEGQVRQAIVNTPIPVLEEKVEAYRPLAYGRALVYSIDEKNPDRFHGRAGLLDIKGTGVMSKSTPTPLVHENGLMGLYDALTEFLFQRLVQLCFEHSGTQATTTSIYAILDAGFDQLEGDNNKFPASIMVRRAHTRPPNAGGLYKYGTAGQLVQLETEKLLRSYGITGVNGPTIMRIKYTHKRFEFYYGGTKITNLTDPQVQNLIEASSCKIGDNTFDGVNIQHTRDISLNPLKIQLVDFGAYQVKGSFNYPLVSLVADKLMRWGGVLFPDDPNYPKPDPKIAVPAKYWGSSTTVFGFPVGVFPNLPRLVARGLSIKYSKGELTSEEVLDLLNKYLYLGTKQLY